MAQLAIKGHPTRGKEIIEILEMLGGKNLNNLDGASNMYYLIGLIVPKILGVSKMELDKTHVQFQFTYFTLEKFLEKYPYKVGDKVILDDIPCTITWMCWECNNIYYQVQGIGDVFTKKVTAEKLKPYKGETMEDKDMSEHTSEINLNHPCFNGHDKIELIIPENWKFEQRGNKMFGIRKYPQYPKTYEECCEIVDYHLEGATIIGYEKPLLKNLQQLLICRDAYWKIAGEQMGLGKPWEPDWGENDGGYRYCIRNQSNKIVLSNEWLGENYILSFPTAEMRDEFYNNFKDLINEVKELL